MRKNTSTSARTRHSSRRSAYCEPEAPVTARVTRRSAMPGLQRLLHLLMDTTESSVAHDHDTGAGFGSTYYLIYDGVDVRRHPCRHRAVGNDGIQRPVQSRRLVPDHLAGLGHARRQRCHVAAQAHGVGTRLDDCDQALVADAGPQAGQGGGDGGRVVGEVVVENDVVDVDELFHPPLGTGETSQSSNALLRRDTDMARGSQGCQRIGDTVRTCLAPYGDALQLAIEPDLEARAIVSQQTRLPVAALAGGLARRPASHVDHPLQGRLLTRIDDQAAGGDGTNQVMELPLDGGKVREDIRVVEFQVIEDGSAGAVMNELGALVEEGTVVLICLHNEERRVAQPSGNAEVLRHAADEKARRHTGVFENPGQQTGGSGLAVGTGYRHDPAILQNMLSQPLRAGSIGDAL